MGRAEIGVGRGATGPAGDPRGGSGQQGGSSCAPGRVATQSRPLSLSDESPYVSQARCLGLTTTHCHLSCAPAARGPGLLVPRGKLVGGAESYMPLCSPTPRGQLATQASICALYRK